MTRLFTADFSGGTTTQWETVQNITYVGEPQYDPGNQQDYGYPLRVISEDKDCGYCGRFELRTGDNPGNGERTEVGEAINATRTPAGTVRWYAFSVKFDSTWPNNHTSLGWATIVQWGGENGGNPPIFWGWQDAVGNGGPDGYWSLFQIPQSAPGVYVGGTTRLLDVALDTGNWIDVKMQVYWSSSDANGYVNVWVNGARQTFLAGAGGGQTFTGRTMIPGDAYIHMHEGLYRETGIGFTGIVYLTGFRIADTENGL